MAKTMCKRCGEDTWDGDYCCDCICEECDDILEENEYNMCDRCKDEEFKEDED